MFFAGADLLQQVIPAGLLQASGEVGGAGALTCLFKGYFITLISLLFCWSPSIGEGAIQVECGFRVTLGTCDSVLQFPRGLFTEDAEDFSRERNAPKTLKIAIVPAGTMHCQLKPSTPLP